MERELVEVDIHPGQARIGENEDNEEDDASSQ